MKCDRFWKGWMGLGEDVKYKGWESSSYFQYNEQKTSLNFGVGVYIWYSHTTALPPFYFSIL